MRYTYTPKAVCVCGWVCARTRAFCVCVCVYTCVESEGASIDCTWIDGLYGLVYFD